MVNFAGMHLKTTVRAAENSHAPPPDKKKPNAPKMPSLMRWSSAQKGMLFEYESQAAADVSRDVACGKNMVPKAAERDWGGVE